MRIHTDYSGKANVRCYLSTEEKLDFGDRLASTSKRIEDLKSSQKSAASSYGSQIKEQEAIRERLVDAISSGFEMRDIACTWRMNRPHTGMKTLYRNDTYEAVDTKVMSDAEKQGVLDLEDREREEQESQERVEAAHDARADAAVETPDTTKTVTDDIEHPTDADGSIVADETTQDSPGDDVMSQRPGVPSTESATGPVDDTTADDHGVKVKGGRRFISASEREKLAATKGAPLSKAQINEEFEAGENAPALQRAEPEAAEVPATEEPEDDGPLA